MTVAAWSGRERSLAVLLNGAAITEPGPRGEVITDQSFLLLFNASDQPVAFMLPAPGPAGGWELMADSAGRPAAASDNGNGADGAASLLNPGSTCEVAAKAALILQAAAS